MNGDNEFLADVCYFWQYKGDIERYTSYDENRLKELNPRIYAAWINYKEAVERMDFVVDKQTNFN